MVQDLPRVAKLLRPGLILQKQEEPQVLQQGIEAVELLEIEAFVEVEVKVVLVKAQRSVDDEHFLQVKAVPLDL